MYRQLHLDSPDKAAGGFDILIDAPTETMYFKECFSGKIWKCVPQFERRTTDPHKVEADLRNGTASDSPDIYA